MKNTGIELITQERKDQIEKHGFTDDSDYTENELVKAAMFAINPEVFEWPQFWSTHFRHKIAKKSKVDRLVIAAALLAAEIDRLNNCK